MSTDSAAGSISVQPGSAEHLTSLLAAGNATAIAAFFHGMSEKERRTFVKPLRAQLKSVSWRVYSEQSSSWDWNDFKAVQRRTSRAQIPASMAVLSTASAVAKYLRTVQRQSTLEIVPDAIRQVLADRNPDWLSELADELSATLSPEGALPVVQAVAAAPACRRR
ncbi:hypothetical protein ACFQ9X_47755 [Catenulispora yoronensis]